MVRKKEYWEILLAKNITFVKCPNVLSCISLEIKPTLIVFHQIL